MFVKEIKLDLFETTLSRICIYIENILFFTVDLNSKIKLS